MVKAGLPTAAGPSTSAGSDLVPSAEPTVTAAYPPRVQEMEKALNMEPFLSQLEKLLGQPIKIPGTLLPGPGPQGQRKNSIFSVKGIYSPGERAEKVAELYNMKNANTGRKWLRDLLLEESDSDSDGEMHFTQKDLYALLKVHRQRRRLQKQYHADPSNSQFTYYGAGLLSTHDPFPEHQHSTLKQNKN